MFDLTELDQAETALRALSGRYPAPRSAPSPQPRRGDIARCPFHNQSRDLAA